jgi:hypothetical protein
MSVCSIPPITQVVGLAFLAHRPLFFCYDAAGYALGGGLGSVLATAAFCLGCVRKLKVVLGCRYSPLRGGGTPVLSCQRVSLPHRPYLIFGAKPLFGADLRREKQGYSALQRYCPMLHSERIDACLEDPYETRLDSRCR